MKALFAKVTESVLSDASRRSERELQQATAMAFAPDGRLFVLEKAGAVRTWTPAVGLPTAPILQVRSCTASEMGLTGIAVDPDFARTSFSLRNGAGVVDAPGSGVVGPKGNSPL